MIEQARQFGSYEQTDILGRGGMGIVYAARHVPSGRRVAIKTALGTDATILSHLRREIRTLAQIDHPGVVRVHDYGVCDGRPWYAMELLEGSTLTDVFDRFWGAGSRDEAAAEPSLPSCDTHPAPRTGAVDLAQTVGIKDSDATSDSASSTGAPAVALPSIVLQIPRAAGDYPPAAAGHLLEALGLVRSICDILAFVHGEGVIHRDLKPDNVFVRDDGQLVLVDFGLAARVSGTAGREVIGGLERVGGSVAYMAPEQINGELHDARCDLYSLGCILYQVLTGQPPFVGSFYEILHGHLRTEPRPLSDLVAGVPAGLDELSAALLAKRRDQRIGYAEDVAAALQRIGSPAPRRRAAQPAVRTYLYRPPFVGRKEVLSSLSARLLKLAENEGGLLFVGGESGAGKTRLVLELASRARQADLQVMTGECAAGSGGHAGRPGQDVPLQPLVPLIEAVADRCVEGGTAALSRLLGEHAALLATCFSAVAALPGVAELPEPPALPAEAARKRLFRCLVETLQAYALRKPLLLVLDDLQWVDELTLGFLEHLAEAGCEKLPVLIVGTYRFNECGPRLEALIAAASCSSRFSVTLMDADEVRQMVGGMLALRFPPPAFVSFLARRSGGNPFFVAEYLHTAVADKVLIRNGAGRWTIAQTESPTAEICEALPLPRSLRQVVELRLGQLQPAARKLLLTAAVMGRRIDVDVLQRAEQLEEEQLLGALQQMVHAQVVEPADDGGYRFVHDKLHEIAAADLDPSRKRRLHHRVAEAMEQIYGEAAAHHAAMGHHFAAAGEAPRAVPHLMKAGDRARSYHAVDESIELYREARQALSTARQVVPSGVDWRSEALSLEEKLGDVLAFTGRHEQAREAFERAFGETVAGEVELRVRLRRKVAKTWEVEHEHERALAAYRQGEALLGAGPDELAPALGREWLQIVLGRAFVYYWLGRVDDLNAEIAAVAPYIETVGTALDRYQYYLTLVLGSYRQNRFRISEQTLRHCLACVAAAKEAQAPAQLAFGRFNLGFGRLFAGQLEAAEGELFEALLAARRVSDAVGEVRIVAYLALVHRLRGRVEQTRAAAAETLRLAEALKMGDYIGLAQACQGWVAYRDGDRQAAVRLLRAALGTWNELSFPFPFRWTAALLLMGLELEDGSPDELLELARELTATTQLWLPDPIDSALLAAMDAQKRGDREAVAACLDKAMVAASDLGYC